MADVLEEYNRRLGVWSDIQGHLKFLHETVLGYRWPVGIELGIQAGNSTSALLSAVAIGGGVLHSCDIQTRAQLEARLPGDRVEWWGHPNWNVLHGSDTSTEVLRRMPRTCDVLFVDTDHSEEHTVEVMEAYMPRVKPGGIALFHDTQWIPAGDIDLGRPEGPVAQGIIRYCKSRGLKWENRAGSYGLGIIRL